ncbi:MAG: hypothetical protein QOJ43_823, partial [Gaiellaceae bacterium]|nr:hypothetical protein [Gaiellaceae bacterium]
MRRNAAFLVALGVLLAALGGTAAESAPTAKKSPRLIAFRSCGQLLGYAKGHANPLVGPYGFGGIAVDRGGVVGAPEAARAAAPVQGIDYSGTNVQEEGVDEPDIVKTDGETLFALAGGRLNAVDLTDTKPRLLDSLRLENGGGELLLHGKRLLVLSNGGYRIEPLPGIARSIAPWQPAKSVLAEIDVSNPKQLRLVRTLTLDGSYVAARLVGGTVRIVSAAQVPSELPFVQPASQTEEALATAKSRNRAVVASSRATSWLPSYRIKRAGAKPGRERPLVQCRHVSRPPEF